jgi:hypothetical protein
VGLVSFDHPELSDCLPDISNLHYGLQVLLFDLVDDAYLLLLEVLDGLKVYVSLNEYYVRG